MFGLLQCMTVSFTSSQSKSLFYPWHCQTNSYVFLEMGMFQALRYAREN